MSQSIVIFGFSGVGKSGLIQALNTLNLKNYSVFDLDLLIKARHFPQNSISDFVEINSMEKFRALEFQVLNEVLRPKEMIIALGGGSLENIEIQKLIEGTFKVWLKDSFENCYQRGLNSIEDRPLFKKTKVELEELFKKREVTYEKLSDFSVFAPQNLAGLQNIARDILLQTKDGGI